MRNDLKLPIPAEYLIPHRLPLRMVDRLLEFQNNSGEAESIINQANILLDSRQRLSPLGVIEIIAQAYAAIKGYDDLLNGRDIRMGYLVGIKEIKFLSPCYAGDRLRTIVNTVKSLGDFTLARGEVMCRGEAIANGTIKVWLPEE